MEPYKLNLERREFSGGYKLCLFKPKILYCSRWKFFLFLVVELLYKMWKLINSFILPRFTWREVFKFNETPMFDLYTLHIPLRLQKSYVSSYLCWSCRPSFLRNSLFLCLLCRRTQMINCNWHSPTFLKGPKTVISYHGCDNKLTLDSRVNPCPATINWVINWQHHGHETFNSIVVGVGVSFIFQGIR